MTDKTPHEEMLLRIGAMERRDRDFICVVTDAYVRKYGNSSEVDTGVHPSNDDNRTNKQPNCINPSGWSISSCFDFLFEMEI